MSNLNKNEIRLLRKVQKFLIAEPRRFNMRYGVMDVNDVSDDNVFDKMLENPPCGTACCIAGAAYVVATCTRLKNTTIPWMSIIHGINVAAQVRFERDIFRKLFYTKRQHDAVQAWPAFYEDAYFDAKTPLERACIGVARIEHFIATDGEE